MLVDTTLPVESEIVVVTEPSALVVTLVVSLDELLPPDDPAPPDAPVLALAAEPPAALAELEGALSALDSACETAVEEIEPMLAVMLWRSDRGCCQSWIMAARSC